MTLTRIPMHHNLVYIFLVQHDRTTDVLHFSLSCYYYPKCRRISLKRRESNKAAHWNATPIPSLLLLQRRWNEKTWQAFGVEL